jgi:inorganic phosphate transporter, PiT family
MSNAHASVLDSKIKRKPGRISLAVFVSVLLGGVAYSGGSLLWDLSQLPSTPSFEFVLLGVTLAIALGFEFVNGFHDTANAVATVIYTHALEPHLAVVWSGLWNFIGVLTSSGAVAFGIVSLLPVELILNAGTHAGFAMIFALLFSAILWNLGTWYFGLPNSSSHTLIGSILGVGLMNGLMAPRHTGTSGVDWTQAIEVGKSLFFSPLIGFLCSGLLFLLMKRFVRNHALYREPVGKAPPPFWIRSMLVLTCTGVSFAHGSNDGQKGMGLIMLILVGTVPAAYALNHAVRAPEVQTFIAVSEKTSRVLMRYASPGATAPAKIRPVLEQLVSQSRIEPDTVPALAAVVVRIAADVAPYGALASVPIELSGNIRNDMYLAGEALGVAGSKHLVPFRPEDTEAIKDYRRSLDRASKFIPTWVKVAVALALGLGTMVGWKRIVITVGERIGKTHLTYAQGAASEVVAMATILAADRFGLPVSTTHVLTSGVAGTMAANHSGLQWGTLRALTAAWLMTLPVSVALSGSLFWLFRHVL